MANFFEKAKFPSSLVPELVRHYENTFSDNFPVQVYDGVHELISWLAMKENVQIAIVSSNTTKNIKTGLTEELASQFKLIVGIDSVKAKANDVAFIGISHGFEDLKMEDGDLGVASNIAELREILEKWLLLKPK
eukprot:g6396.t1